MLNRVHRTHVRPLLIVVTILAALFAGGRAAMADAEYNPVLATRVAQMQDEDSILIKRDASKFRFVGDEARVFLRTDYDLQTIYIPVAVAKVSEVGADTCLLKVVARTDQITTANWVAFDQTLEAKRTSRYETAMTEARSLIKQGEALQANALLDKLKEDGFQSLELEALTTGIDLDKVRTPEGQLLKEIIPDPELRNQLAEGQNYLLTLRMLRKQDWPDPSLLRYALELLPTLDKRQREELEITLF